jgi:hypothetical protein
MGTMSEQHEPRLEAASRAYASGYDSYPEPAKRSIHEEVAPLLKAADEADRKAGTVRVTANTETVERIARAIHKEQGDTAWETLLPKEQDEYYLDAHAVLAALGILGPA